MSTPNTRYTDVAIMGTGTAGLAAYRAVKAAGLSALLIEGQAYGTTCARVGCMPSKLLIAAAEAAHEARHTEPFGIRVDGVQVDGREVMARVRGERDRFVGFVVQSVDGIPEEDKLWGMARFVDNTVLQVGEGEGAITVHARRVVIATGSSPAVPPGFRELGDRLIINDDVFSWETLPRRVAVFGPGVIGLELGQALSRLGVDIRLFGMGGSVGPLSDPQVRDYAKGVFASEFYLDVDAKVESMRRDGEEVVIRYVRGEEVVEERFDYVLAATGRRPNVDNIGLENTAVALDARGVPVFDRNTLQCGSLPVFLAGDVNNILPLLHEAADEGKLAGENAAGYPQLKTIRRRAPLAVVFSNPQIAIVGQRYAELDAGQIVTGEVSFEDQGRSRVMLKNRGLMHVYADRKTGRFLGAEWIGPRAENIAHTLAWAYQMNLTIDDMLAMPFYHPVVEEGVRTALRDAAAKLAA
ncbi:dihydrolipoyl dehydrogenase [Laribacter hongkongensis]|uniref:dihydrolipoyl dehydrogenase n=1 Tax=Laribacter hongkongensis TaxID=168471 RepID=UPI001EFD01ED|nr:dihydrolipoyl dehydrogenase [Laribacter hongkongensis]MCG9052386.1 dihydrolipoyl dehydrogenase [Laribacter hongkongensis]